MRLRAVDGADPVAVGAGLPAALDGAAPLALGFAPGPGDDVADGTAVVIATSGSTGVPKRVVLSAAALTASAEATARRIGSGQWMLALSAGYVAGLQVLVRAHLAGTAPVLLEGRFTPASFAAATRGMGAGPRYASLVPAQLATLLDAAEDRDVREALASYDALLLGGQALPPVLRERAAALGARVVRTYGSSETAGGCVYDGVALDGVRVASVDGELRIAGPTLADGYLGDPELTARTFVADAAGERWYRTGDAGDVADGRVAVTGRIDNVIVSGGTNVSLDRVERAVRAVAGLEGAVVAAIADERWGQGSAIVVALRTGLADSAPALLAAARERVAAEVGAEARPARIVPVEALPLLSSGKPDRRAIAALAAGR
ncbi:AMP-binding protein [Microbacterium azadirachtae]|uniref:2-succinylbenzoate--CoA ligase n=1 Tax=Microbacterium azadirachtae TaxID=582680 RepID=A0A0F0LWE2_9MICO|nr:AMP-binding protein [Microbacterium azadirachtae]KJL37019.1 2-succinylbenzoate--CoA ligase [Microbacterium azadirachtae]